MIRIADKGPSDAKTFLLTNRAGSYAMLSPKPASRFEGVFLMKDSRMFKVIEDIRPGSEVRSVNAGFWQAERHYDGFSERFFMPHEHDCIVYQASKETEVELILDCKKSYDDRQWGRNYTIKPEEGAVVVSFIKTTSKREDSSEGAEEFGIYIVIRGDFSHEINDRWEEHSYDYDELRQSHPWKRYVYNSVRLRGKKLVIAFGSSLEKARAEAEQAERRLGVLIERQKQRAEMLLDRAMLEVPDSFLSRAYTHSIMALDSMRARLSNQVGLYAGLPWFFQFWTRDESISIRALILIGKLRLAENILLRHIGHIRHDGRVPNRFPPSLLGTADGVGWVFKRVEAFLDYIERHHKIKGYLSLRLKKKIIRKLENAVYLTHKYHERDGLVFNDTNETWMDTDFGGDKRDGFRIEIQALHLAMYRLLYRLTKDKRHHEEELRLKSAVRKAFFINGELLDGVGDSRARPNIFIAAYVYPELLTRVEWQSAFDRVLPRLWLEWGGLASIGKDDRLFCPRYDAKENRSYHRGDSWYFVNNLAAIAMHRVNPVRYMEKVEGIMRASANEINNKGVQGYHAELSHAERNSSMGCLAQTWSSATFIELIWEIYGKKR